MNVPCGSALQNVLNNAGYNIVSADLTLGISPSQQYAMSLNGATVGLQILDQNGAKVGGVVSLNADGTATLNYPTLAADGKPITSISIVPTLTLADPTFTTQTGLTLVPGVDISALALSAGPLSLGPLFDYSPSLPPIPQLTLNSTTFGLGGFSSATLSSTSGVGANTTITNSTAISNNIDFQSLNATNQSLTYTTLTIHDSTVTGGTFTGNPNIEGVCLQTCAPNTFSSAMITGDAAVPQTLLNGVTLNLAVANERVQSSPALTTNGNVTFVNSTVQSPADAVSTYPESIFVQSGTLTFQNSTITNQFLEIGNATVVLSQSSMTGNFQNNGTLTLDNSTLTVPDNANVSATNAPGGSVLNLNNGSTLHVGAGDSFYNDGTINIGSGSLLRSDYYICCGAINLSAGGTFTASGTVDGATASSITSNAGGTVNLNGVTGLTMRIQNTSGAPGGTVNVSGITTLNGGYITGMALINIDSSAQLNLNGLAGFSATSIVNNGTLVGAGSFGGNVAGSILNNGTITGVGLDFIGTTVNSASGLILAGNQQETNFTNLNNRGGTIDVQKGGTVGVFIQGLLPGQPDTSQFTQSSGNTIVDGTLIATNVIRLEGGTLSGIGTVRGSVGNDGGVLNPGDGGVGTLTILNGDYIQGAGGTLEINIDSLTDFSRLALTTDDVSGLNVDLGGTLDVVLDANFLSELESEPGGLESFLGTQFDILKLGSDDFTNESLDGMFSNLEFTDSEGNALPFGFTWDVSEVFPSFLTDNTAPYAELLLTFSTVSDCGDLGQALLNGDVNGGCSADYSADEISPSTFNPGPLDLSSISTPEPGTLVLLAVGLAAFAALARRKGRAV